MTEADEDARMRALFGDLNRPPMGDEAFVGAVMTRVKSEKAAIEARQGALLLGLLAAIGALLSPFRDAIGLQIAASFQRVAPDLSMLGAGGSALLIAAAVSAAAWAWSERG